MVAGVLETAKLGCEDEPFGPTVGVSGQRIVVGGPMVGAACVFDDFDQKHVLTSGPSMSFGRAVAIDGAVLVADSDTFYVYDDAAAPGRPYEGGGPVATAGDVAVGGAENAVVVVVGNVSRRIEGTAGFGRHVAVSDPFLVVGAANSTFVYKRCCGKYDEVATIERTGPVAVSGSVAVIGSRALKTYDAGATWSTLFDNEVSCRAVAIDDLIVCGLDDAALVWRNDGSLFETLTPSDKDCPDFGGTVAISGYRVVVGALGAAYIYDLHPPTTPASITNITAANKKKKTSTGAMVVHTFLPVFVAMVFALVVGAIFACGLAHGRVYTRSTRTFVVIAFE